MKKDQLHAQEGTVVEISLFHYLSQIVWKIFRFVLMACMVFIILYPLLYMVSMAFRTVEDVYDPSIVWIPRHWSIESFRIIIEINDYIKLLGNTTFLSLVSTLIQLFTCSMVGYGFARFRFRFRGILFGIMLFTIIVPPQMLSLPTFINFKDFDIMGVFTAVTGHGFGSLLDNPGLFFVLALFGQGIRSGLFILIFCQFYRGLPMELENAALVDGCGGFRTYFRIMLPNARNVLLMVFLFSLVWYWNDYYMTTIYLSSFPTVATQLATLRGSLELYMQQSAGSSAFDPYQIVTMEQAACLLTILPLLILYILTQKYFTESIEKTGIVG